MHDHDDIAAAAAGFYVALNALFEGKLAPMVEDAQSISVEVSGETWNQRVHGKGHLERAWHSIASIPVDAVEQSPYSVRSNPSVRAAHPGRKRSLLLPQEGQKDGVTIRPAFDKRKRGSHMTRISLLAVLLLAAMVSPSEAEGPVKSTVKGTVQGTKEIGQGVVQGTAQGR